MVSIAHERGAPARTEAERRERAARRAGLALGRARDERRAHVGREVPGDAEALEDRHRELERLRGCERERPARGECFEELAHAGHE
jgi:hypothetical protein